MDDIANSCPEYKVSENKRPLLSILIPVYNVENLLPECLDSLLEQKFDKDDYEIICVNDGSPDNSGNILKKYASEYSEIKVITKENGGLPTARYAGYLHARGSYVWFVDSDDFVNENSLHTIKKAILENNYPDVLNFRFYLLPWDGVETRINILNHRDILKSQKGDITIWNNVYKKDMLDKNDILAKYADKNVSYSEDTLFRFYTKIYQTSESKIDDTLIFYRQNPKSMTHYPQKIKDELKRTNDYLTVTESVKEVFDNYEEGEYNCDKSYIACILMCKVWILTELLACIPTFYMLRYLRLSIKKGIFPIEIPDEYSVSKENTLKWSYGKTKTEKWLNCHSHTRFGFFLMYIYYTPIRIKTSLKRFLNKT